MTFSSLSETTIQRIEALRGARESGDARRIYQNAIRLLNALYDLNMEAEKIRSEADQSLPPLTEYDPGQVEHDIWQARQERSL